MNTDSGHAPSDGRSDRWTRRDALRLAGAAGVGLLGVALSACGQAPSAAVPPNTLAPKPTQPPNPTGATQPTAPAQQAPATGGTSAAWDALLADARNEGKLVVSGPPNDDVRKQIPEVFRRKYGIEVDYIGGSSSQLASRIQSERAAGEYTIDVSMGGSDTFYRTFLKNGWLDPIKPVLLLPEVTDPSKWKTGGPWFRDPERHDTILQIFNTINPTGYVNADMIAKGVIKTADDLLSPTYTGKLGSFNPAVNGGGVLAASGFYVSKGEEFMKQLYKDQVAAITRDYKQLSDWVAHGNYPIGLGIRPADMDDYKGVVNYYDLDLPDLKDAVSGGFGMIGLYQNAPHPAAAKVYVNWIATREGTTLYGKADAQAPVRTDVDPSGWLPARMIPKPGQDVVDSYDYEFVTQTRAKIQQILAPLVGAAGA